MTRPVFSALPETSALPAISDQLRDAVRSSGLSYYDLGFHRCRPQLDPSLISRFVAGTRTLTLRSADALARALGLDLIPHPHETALSGILLQVISRFSPGFRGSGRFLCPREPLLEGH